MRKLVIALILVAVWGSTPADSRMYQMAPVPAFPAGEARVLDLGRDGYLVCFQRSANAGLCYDPLEREPPNECVFAARGGMMVVQCKGR
jgi:hypothetical protein